jgi:hypothetical protein
MELPKEYQNIMITYIATVRIPDKYYGHDEVMEVTRRAFYCKSDGYYNRKDEYVKTPNGYFSVPQYWQELKGSLLPHSFYSYGRVLPENIIKWELDTK